MSGFYDRNAGKARQEHISLMSNQDVRWRFEEKQYEAQSIHTKVALAVASATMIFTILLFIG